MSSIKTSGLSCSAMEQWLKTRISSKKATLVNYNSLCCQSLRVMLDYSTTELNVQLYFCISNVMNTILCESEFDRGLLLYLNLNISKSWIYWEFLTSFHQIQEHSLIVFLHISTTEI
jgi:hypothetical protein